MISARGVAARERLSEDCTDGDSESGSSVSASDAESSSAVMRQQH